MNSQSTTDTVIYAIGDVHGMGGMLATLMTQIAKSARGAHEKTRLVFLGDLFDRGARSDIVLQCVRAAFKMWPESILISGNHEDIIRTAIAPGGTYFDFLRWVNNGGLETLSSFSPSVEDLRAGDPIAEMEKIKSFMQSRSGLDLVLNSRLRRHVYGEYCFVHAGVRPGVLLTEQDDRDLAWIREEFLEHREPFEKIIVHGHTETEGRHPEVWPNRIALDTAAWQPGGRLSCLEFRNGVAQGFIAVPHDKPSTIETFSLEECDMTTHRGLRDALVG